MLEFSRLVKAQEQVVSGTLHHLTLEAIDAGKKKIYEAKVLVKPWMNFKELQEFKHSGDASASFKSSDLGVKKGLQLKFNFALFSKFDQLDVFVFLSFNSIMLCFF